MEVMKLFCLLMSFDRRTENRTVDLSLHADFSWWGGVERLESGLISCNDWFYDAGTETKWKTTIVFCVSCILVQVKFEVDFFLVDSNLAVFWVSLKFEERSEDTASFPLTLNNFLN